jgi:hypothetical protein
VPPGQEGKISLVVEHTDNYSGEISKFATVTTNDPSLPTFGLTLHVFFISDHKPGSTPPPVSISAPAKKLGPFGASPSDRWVTATFRGQSVNNTITFTNSLATPAHITKVVAGGASFGATLFTIEDGKKYQLSLASNPDLQAGKYTQTAIVYTDSKEAPEIPIELEVTVMPHVIAVPATVTLPRMQLESDLSKIFIPVITVRKVRESGLKVKDVSVDLPFLKVEIVPSAADVYQIHITLDKTKISAPGEFNGKIRIETNDSETPLIIVPVNCRFS